MLNLTITCNICGGDTELHLEEEAFAAWQRGTLVQDAFPNLGEDERELLISQTCAKCFKGLFAEMEEA